jgi:hypothetical protein
MMTKEEEAEDAPILEMLWLLLAPLRGMSHRQLLLVMLLLP